MRTFIFAVAAAIVATSWAIDQTLAADRIPAFDIARNCSAEVASAGIEKVAGCTPLESSPGWCGRSFTSSPCRNCRTACACSASGSGRISPGSAPHG